MSFVNHANELIEEIENTRKLMISTALEKGFMCVQTLELSQSLDQMLNQFHLVNLELNSEDTKLYCR
ncbi:Spo0E family sporulation regulatory protein-aspartic acid phosphatase [Bacillus paramycoides]|uniref:Spo0E family sporulation regulatory protein-aspartic acid phosphatase n=1 Tax=Bacillus paramycoides TaxID=2026194 RepID=UPI003CFF7483